MTTLETRYGNFTVLSDGQINLQFDCCAIDSADGIATLVDYYNIFLLPIADINAVLAQSSLELEGSGFSPLSDYILAEVLALCQLEHTPEVQLRFQVAMAQKRSPVLEEEDERARRALLALGVEAEGEAAEEEEKRQALIIVIAKNEEEKQGLLAFIAENYVPSTHQGIKKEVCFGAVRIKADGLLEVQMRKCVVVDGVVIGSPKVHLMSLPPGGSPQATINVNTAQLALLGDGPITDETKDRLLRICTLIHTPERITTYREAAAARRDRN